MKTTTTNTNTQVINIRTAQTLILGRIDMNDTEYSKEIFIIEPKDFKIPMFLFNNYEIVLFIDNDGQTKLLKNRFGNL
jgi:hypothetical protein